MNWGKKGKKPDGKTTEGGKGCPTVKHTLRI